MLLTRCNCSKPPRHSLVRSYGEFSQKLLVNDKQIQRRDPTGTAGIRSRFLSEMNRRWRALRRLSTIAIAEQDTLGISVVSVGSLQNSSKPEGVGFLNAEAGSDKVKAFQSWFDKALGEVILGSDGKWMTKHIVAGYDKGIKDALKRVGEPGSVDVADRASTLVMLTIAELQGVMEAVSQRAVRALADGILHRLRPLDVVRNVNSEINKIGVVRSNSMVNAMVVRSHSTASLDMFEASKVKRVGVLPEFVPGSGTVMKDEMLTDAKKSRKRRSKPRGMIEILTAGDDLVCEECEDLARGTYEIGEARGLIPAHPNCRCAFVPADDDRFAEAEEEE